MSRSLTPRILAASLVVLLLTATPSLAQTTYTWTGGGSTNGWSDALNWSVTSGPGTPPPPSDLNETVLVMTGNTRTTNVLDQNLSANMLMFNAAAGAFTVNGTSTLTIGPGGIEVATGNANNQALNASLAAGSNTSFINNGTGVFTVGGAINTGTFQITVGGTGNSVLSGAISGTGGLTMNGPGTVTLTGNSPYSGQTNVLAGTLAIGPGGSLTGTSAVGVVGTGTLSVASGGSVTAPLVVAFGVARIEGTGTLNSEVLLGRITDMSGNPLGEPGGVISGGVNGVGTLTVNNLYLGTGATMSFRITSAGTPASANTGGSSTGSPSSPTNNNYIHVLQLMFPVEATDMPTLRFIIDGTGTTFTPGQSYSYRVGQADFNEFLGEEYRFAGAGVQGQFSTIGIANAENFSLLIADTGIVYVNFTIASPVPEPATVLGLAAGALGLGRLVRRRFRKEAAAA